MQKLRARAHRCVAFFRTGTKLKFHGVCLWNQLLPSNLLKTDFPLKSTIVRCLCKPQYNMWKYEMIQYIFVRSSTRVVHILIRWNFQYVKRISAISMWVDFSQSQDWLLYLLKWFKSISRWICSAESAQVQFCGLFKFFYFTYFFFPEEDNFPLSGKLCDVSNFQLRLHQREFKMVVPPSKVLNFFQRKEISQKLETFFHFVSSSHRPFINSHWKKKDFEWVRRQGGLLKPKVNRSSTGFAGESFKITMGQNMQKSSKCHQRQQSFKLSSMGLWFWLEERR